MNVKTEHRHALWLPLAIVAAALLTAAVSWAARAQFENARSVLTVTEEVFVGPAQVLAGPRVADIQIAPGGRYALAVEVATPFLPPLEAPERQEAPAPAPRDAPPRVVRITLWSSARERVSTVWRSDAGPTETQTPAEQVSLQGTRWLPGTFSAVLTLARGDRRHELVLVNCVQGSSRTVPMPGGPEDGEASAPYAMHVVPAPGGREALLVSRYEPGPNGRMVARRLDVAAGTVSAPLFRVPGDYGPSSEGFTPDGRGIYVVRLEKTGEGKPRLAYAVADARTGALTPLAGPPEPAPPAASPHVSSKGVIARTVGGRFTGLTDIGEPDGSAPAAPDTRLQAVYLESLAGAGAGIPEASRRALVAADAGGVMLLPDGSALLYMSRGSLFVCPLRRRPRAPAPAAQVQ